MPSYMGLIRLYKKLESGPTTDPDNYFGDLMIKKNLWVGRILIPLGLCICLIGLIMINLEIAGIGAGISLLGIFALMFRRYFMANVKGYNLNKFDKVILLIGALVGLVLGVGGLVLLSLGFAGFIEMQAGGYIFYIIISLFGFYGFWEDLQKIRDFRK